MFILFDFFYNEIWFMIVSFVWVFALALSRCQNDIAVKLKKKSTRGLYEIMIDIGIM